jgi:hypothetical protein
MEKLSLILAVSKSLGGIKITILLVVILFSVFFVHYANICAEFVNGSFRVYSHNDMLVYLSTEEVWVRKIGYVRRKRKVI